jgi:glycine dehydrogenase
MSSQILTHFAKRHIGISSIEKEEMLNTIGVGTLDQLIDETVPSGIRMQKTLNLPEALQEHEYLAMLKKLVQKIRSLNHILGRDITIP